MLIIIIIWVSKKYRWKKIFNYNLTQLVIEVVQHIIIYLLMFIKSSPIILYNSIV